MDFSGLLAPLTPERFAAEHEGRLPVHLPAPEGSPRRGLFGWAQLNAMLALRPYWTAETLVLKRNGKTIPSSLYMEETLDYGRPEPRASLPKVEAFLAAGASLLANAAQQVSPELRRLTDTAGEALGARVGANVYASFEGVAALDTHFDYHDVFALQCEGEKRWRVYEDPVDRPTVDTHAPHDPSARTGPPALRFEVTMRPGDLLYIPRGFLHDALATGGSSLHVSLGVHPAGASELFRLLKDFALADGAFRDRLPDARTEGGAALGRHLDDLAGRLTAILRSPAFEAELAESQRRLARPAPKANLPERPTLEHYVRTKREAELVRDLSGATLRLAGPDPETLPLGADREAAAWILARPLFSLQELAAAFSHRPEGELRELIGRLAAADLLRPVAPARGS